MFFSIVSFLYLILRIEGYSTSNNSSGGIEKTVLNSSTEPRFRRKLETPTRALQAPFPDGLNGGNLITLPPRKHYLKQKSSSNLGTDLADSFILPARDIKVWTPPEYNDPKYADLRYPVLYVHDGQNAMQDSSSWTGYSWRLAGALTRMAERKQLKTNEHSFPPIIVMIPSATDRLAFVPRRHLEYGDISTAFSQAHADFVGLTLKPLIDEEFRTMPEKEHTSTIGSSLGGQASLNLLLRFPELFGKDIKKSHLLPYQDGP
ncbi:hypothetical protein CTEN210_08558 [Chaetoceros tenuissimus]|uniref:Esterase n=1 Tax=Chaetoceros tenuissimus TaxID=426638 RepID=A0AAD3H665_9STRA|nr:hypothetical protein CTEN210_08558 [Chaetoceros tenuissimus]